MAVVVAESEQAARDVADLVWVDVEPLPTVPGPEEGADSDAPLLFPQLGTNIIYDRGESVDDVLTDAEIVVEFCVANQRLAAVPLEISGAVVVPRQDGGLHFWLPSQSAHLHQSALPTVLGLDTDLIRVEVPDVGGGFGAKIPLYLR